MQGFDSKMRMHNMTKYDNQYVMNRSRVKINTLEAAGEQEKSAARQCSARNDRVMKFYSSVIRSRICCIRLSRREISAAQSDSSEASSSASEPENSFSERL